MSQSRQAVADFIRAGKELLEAEDLSDDEEDSVRDILWQLSLRFPTKETTRPTSLTIRHAQDSRPLNLSLRSQRGRRWPAGYCLSQ